jgi:hypothetical protein
MGDRKTTVVNYADLDWNKFNGQSIGVGNTWETELRVGTSALQIWRKNTDGPGKFIAAELGGESDRYAWWYQVMPYDVFKYVKHAAAAVSEFIASQVAKENHD